MTAKFRGRLIPVFFAFFIYLSIVTASASPDVNGDGEITSVDALMALKMSVGRLDVDLRADMDGDGVVSAYDAYRILMLSTGEGDDLFFLLGEVVKSYDFGKYIKNERMNWIIEKNDGNRLVIGVVIENGKVTRFSKGGISNQNVNVYAGEDTVKYLLDSRNPEDLKNAIKSGEIKFQGVGLMNQIKYSIFPFLTYFS